MQSKAWLRMYGIPDLLANRKVGWAILVVGSVVALSVLITLEQISMVLAFCELFCIAVAIFHSPNMGWKLLILLVSVNGLLGRIALYFAGQEPRFDFLVVAIEFGTLLLVSRIFLVRKTGPSVRMDKPADRAILVYLAFSSLSALNIFTAGPVASIWGWRWVCIPILLYFVGRSVIQSEADIRSLFSFLSALLAILSMYGLYQFIGDIPFFERPWFESLPEWGNRILMIEGSQFLGGKPRIISTTEGHSQFMFSAAFLFIAVLFVPRKYISQRYRYIRILALITTIMCAVVSRERSFIGMLIIGVIVGLALYNLQKRRYVQLLGFVAVLLAASILLLSTVDPGAIPWSQDTVALKRLAWVTNPMADSSIRTRVMTIWPRAIETILGNPVGFGLGAFHYTSVVRNQAHFFSPHNMYFQIALETGLIGLILFLIVVWHCFSEFRRGLASLEPLLYAGVVSAVIIALVEGMFNFPLERPLSFVFWFFLGAAISISRVVRESSSLRGSKCLEY